MFCKYCGKNAGNTDICRECNEKINNFMFNNSDIISNNETTNYNQNYEYNKKIADTNISEKEPVKYKGFFSLPRVLAILGAVIFAFCCIMPQYLVDDLVKDIAIADLQPYGMYIFVIPILIIFNAIFDKSIFTLSITGFHWRFLRLKLCILWGLVGICILFFIPFGIGYNIIGYTAFYYASWLGCIMAIIAPFLVRENDGTGIKPVKKYDFIWIVPAVVLALFLCFRVYSVNSDNGTSVIADTSDITDAVENSDNDEVSDNSSAQYSESEPVSETEFIDEGSYYENESNEDNENLLSELENFMNEYCSAMVLAINNNDYSIVEPYIKSGSPLEASQRKLIESLNEKGISEEFVSLNLIDVDYDEDTNYLYLYVEEKENIYYSNGEVKAGSYNWKYYLDGNGEYLELTDIE